jgi:guanylate kinase
MPESVTVFVMPPSLAELERRLRGRATDDEQVIQRRLSKAREEMSHWGDYDYVVVNDQVPQALETLRDIVGGRNSVNRVSDPALRGRVLGIAGGGG